MVGELVSAHEAYYSDDDDNTKNFVGNPPPHAPENPTQGDFFVDNDGNIWIYQPGLGDSSHGGWTSTGNINSWNFLNPNNELPKEGTFTDLLGNEYTRNNLTGEYQQNILDEQSGSSLLNFVNKREELRNLIKENDLSSNIIELDPIDLTTAKKNMIGQMSINPATGLPDVNSMNFANPYMEIFPEIANFDDVVYS